MIDTKILDIFIKIEKEYKNNNLQWGNYLSQLDWDIIEGNLKVSVKNTDKKVIAGNLKRAISHELRDDAIISILKMINVKTVLDIGADTGLFLAKCKYNGIEGVGIEPNRTAVNYVNKKGFVELFCLDLQTLMKSFKNRDMFDLCSMLNFFHGAWKDIREKDSFARYLAQNFKYVILSDDYKNNKPDPIIMEYFELVYDFNMYGMIALRDFKNMTGPLKRYFSNFLQNQIYDKVHILSIHKLYIPK